MAEARAAGEAQRDDEDMDAVRGELDEAKEEHTHLSASKQRRLAAREKRDAARHPQLQGDECAGMWGLGFSRGSRRGRRGMVRLHCLACCTNLHGLFTLLC